MTYWQIAAGAGGRDYARDFLRYGLAFVGGPSKVETMRQVKAGDRILLKRGLHHVVAAGVVVERDGVCRGEAGDAADDPRAWLRDYDGWDLPAYCHVEWHTPEQPITVNGLTRGTILQVHQLELRAVADEILRSAPTQDRAVEPQPTRAVSDDEILAALVREGLGPSNAEALTATLRRIRLLARYYYQHCAWEDVREHEARTFLIVPFLLALGWSEQQIKIELGVTGGRIDIACFRSPYRRNEHGDANHGDCALILESKGFSQGLDYAHAQGKAYAKEFARCEVVVASNGYCYKAYRRLPDGAGFAHAPSAYLNLLRPRNRYPLQPDADNGAIALLRHLMAKRG